jgi:hypothetical protein
VRLRAHVIIRGQFVKAGTEIPEADLPRAFLKYREGGPPIPGLREGPDHNSRLILEVSENACQPSESEAPVFGRRYFLRGRRFVRADYVQPRPRELIFKWDGMDFVCCGIIPDPTPR